MKNKIGLLVILFILILMAVTNTTKREYTNFVKNKYAQQAGRTADKSFLLQIDNTFNNNTTQVKNCILFSIYKTSIGEDNFQAIGVFRTFTFTPKIGSLLMALGIIIAAVIAIILVLRSNAEDKNVSGSV